MNKEVCKKCRNEIHPGWSWNGCRDFDSKIVNDDDLWKQGKMFCCANNVWRVLWRKNMKLEKCEMYFEQLNASQRK
jgi:hypothetical protein